MQYCFEENLTNMLMNTNRYLIEKFLKCLRHDL